MTLDSFVAYLEQVSLVILLLLVEYWLNHRKR
jgi:hypothetical protein